MPNFLERLLSGRRERHKATKETPELVLPYPVRDHLKESTLMPKDLVRSLVRDGSMERPGFENAAVYLTLKASSGDPELEKALLGDLAAVLAENREAGPEARAALLRGFVESSVERIPGEWSVDARNIARISRHGFRLTDERYRTHASRLAADPRNVFIVGHATFAGLASFIDAFARAGKRLYIVIPAFLANESPDIAPDKRNFPTGYVIEPNGIVRDLTKADFSSPEGKVIVDDVRRTGKTEQQIRAYFEAFGITNAESEPLQDASDA